MRRRREQLSLALETDSTSGEEPPPEEAIASTPLVSAISTLIGPLVNAEQRTRKLVEPPAANFHCPVAVADVTPAPPPTG